MAIRLLVVDDEPDICEILRFNLELEGYDVRVQEAPSKLMEPIPDLIILDVMMSPVDGFQWARELRSDPLTKNIPIIFCTAKSQEDDLLEGFSCGGDDYICKPFRMSEVKARVRAVLSRSASRQEAEEKRDCQIRFEGLVLETERKVCLVDGQEVSFTKLEFELLVVLVGNPNRVFSRQEILSKAWPSDTVVLDRTVDVNITRIRKKIGRYGCHIRTKFGYGYQFST